MAFLTDPGKVHAILDRLADNVIAWGLALAARGADAIDLSSAFVAAPFLSRRNYQEFVVPYERRVNEALKAAGHIVYTHSCGKIGDRLDLLAETGTLRRGHAGSPPLGNCEIADAKREYGERLFFKGNMNSVALLQYRTRKEVLAEAMRPLRIGKPAPATS